MGERHDIGGLAGCGISMRDEMYGGENMEQELAAQKEKIDALLNAPLDDTEPQSIE